MEKLRSRVLALAVLAGFAVAAGPAAADGDRDRDRDYPAAWRGMYAGVHLGHGDAGGGLDGFVGGAQLGYNWQNGLIVYGWEADVTLSGMEESRGGAEVGIDWMATARGRLGYLIQPNILAYATAGLGLYSFYADGFGPPFDGDDTETDFVFGFGIEGQFNQNTTLRVEYLDIDDIDIIRAGVNFKLNGY